ncbi:MAG TPA: extracellular solute-binding protein [Anaerolineae bacterium]|nr:extracellular solute-binding protein [Anaerolineae bacterium]
MSKRFPILLISLLIIASVVLGACKAAEPTPAPPEEGKPAEPVTEEVTLRVWTHQNDAFNEGYANLAEAYMAEHPNVTITFETFDYDTYIQTLQTALPAGTEADILQMFGSWVCSYVEGDNLAAVPSDVLSMDKARDTVFSAQLAGYICDDTLYGIPQEFNIEYGAVLVNTRLAQEVGIEDIEEGWANWDEFIADAQKLVEKQDDVMIRAGYHFTASDAIPATFYSLILQYGGQYLTDEGFRVNTPEGKQALEFMISLVDAGVVDPVLFNDEENWVGDAYFEELTAIGLVGPWVIPEYAADYPDIVDVTRYIQLPSFSDEPVFVASSGWGLTVSARSQVKETAWDFISYAVLNPENATQWNIASGTLPALKANAAGAGAEKLMAEFPYFEPFLAILEYGQHEGHFPDRDLVWYEITYSRILNALQGNMSVEETLETLEREVNESY